MVLYMHAFYPQRLKLLLIPSLTVFEPGGDYLHPHSISRGVRTYFLNRSLKLRFDKQNQLEQLIFVSNSKIGNTQNDILTFKHLIVYLFIMLQCLNERQQFSWLYYSIKQSIII